MCSRALLHTKATDQSLDRQTLTTHRGRIRCLRGLRIAASLSRSGLAATLNSSITNGHNTPVASRSRETEMLEDTSLRTPIHWISILNQTLRCMMIQRKTQGCSRNRWYTRCSSRCKVATKIRRKDLSHKGVRLWAPVSHLLTSPHKKIDKQTSLRPLILPVKVLKVKCFSRNLLWGMDRQFIGRL